MMSRMLITIYQSRPLILVMALLKKLHEAQGPRSLLKKVALIMLSVPVTIFSSSAQNLLHIHCSAFLDIINTIHDQHNCLC